MEERGVRCEGVKIDEREGMGACIGEGGDVRPGWRQLEP